MRALALATLGLLLVLAAPLSAQRKAKPKPAVDPYTRGEVEAMRRAGYASFGPFPFGDTFTTADVDQLMGEGKVIWVETVHFRIGSTLEEYSLPKDAREKKKIRAELIELKELLPRVDPKSRKLDPWLRLHLYAWRVEELYAEFLELFALAEEDFPVSQADKRLVDYMGEGPYLGQPGKFTILVTARASDFARFTKRFLESDSFGSHRRNFAESGSMFFGTSEEFLAGEYANDSALHCEVAHWVAFNLVAGLRFFWNEPPHWWVEGLGHWFSRRIDPRWFFAGNLPDGQLPTSEEWDWKTQVSNRVDVEYFTALETMLSWRGAAEMSFPDHMMAWSKVDFVLGLGPDVAGAFLIELTDPQAGGDAAELVRHQREALQEVLELDTAAFDRAWADFVRTAYVSR